MGMQLTTLQEAITQTFKIHSARQAIEVGPKEYAYDAVASLSYNIANTLGNCTESSSAFIAIFGYRSITAYTGILGALLSGYAYMPLSPRFPVERLHTMLWISGCNTMILSEECAEAFLSLGKVAKGLKILCPEPRERIRQLAKELPQHQFIFPEQFAMQPPKAPRIVRPQDPAYLLFTSGSTGIPKGVVVSHSNVCAYLSYTINRYGVTPEDRFSQMFDMTFDLSVHDIFVSLLSGACLCVVPESSLMAPAKFIKEKQLTMWFSVPSVAMFMSGMRMLKPDSFKSLRYSLFCGEALPAKSAEMWQKAAPNSILENLYGPTEATIAITNYRWDNEVSHHQCANGVVPIGWPFDNHSVRVVDQNGREVQKGSEGELCLSGPQVTSGYLNNSVETEKRFVIFENAPESVWYRTGDWVLQNKDGCLQFLGRVDDQIQVRGYRVELQEIDKVLREAAGVELAVCVPKITTPGSADAIFAFIEGNPDRFSTAEIFDTCKKRLPEYMMPEAIFFIEKMPLNDNGKINRKELAANEEYRKSRS